MKIYLATIEVLSTLDLTLTGACNTAATTSKMGDLEFNTVEINGFADYIVCNDF